MSDRASDMVSHEDPGDAGYSDGRDIDTRIAELSGEASDQLIKTDQISKSKALVNRSAADEPTYYQQPLLKRSVWSIDIPLYYFCGGAAGAALALGAALQVRRDPELRDFSRHCHWIGIAGSSVGAVLLIHDLGKPSRFLNMMRVFRPTSPMNMGAWILGGGAPTAIATGLFINRGGFLGALGELTGFASGGFGSALAGYTGVVVSNSAIPVWQEARHWMPVLFMASSVASAGSLLDLLYEHRRASRISFAFGTIGRVAELVAANQVENSARNLPKVAAPFKNGPTSILWKASMVLGTASLIVSAVPGKSAKRRKVAGVLGVLGSLALRFAVHYISNASAEDARASFQHQRQRLPASAAVTRRSSAGSPAE